MAGRHARPPLARQAAGPKTAAPAGRRDAHAQTADHETAAASGVGGWYGTSASAAVVMAAFALSFHKIDDFDTWWHLAAGRWIAVHHAIPVTDTLSHTVRDHSWINLQWGFDLGLYLLQRLGGPSLLCVAGGIVASATVVLLMRLIGRQLGSSLGAIVTLLAVVTAQERIGLRPELLSFLLLVSVLTVLEHGRSNGRGLFLLVPLMIVWVNVHALFVLGGFAIVCAFVGNATMPPRRLMYWGGAALASVLVNPYGLEGALFPLKLVSRINGSSPVFQTVGEFLSPFNAGVTGVSMVLYKVMLAIGCAALAAALIVSLRSARARPDAWRTRFDWGGAIFFAGLAVLSVAARRNVAIFAIGAAPFIARCLAIVLTSGARIRTAAARCAPFAAATVVISAVLLSASVVTGTFYKLDGVTREFGGGVLNGSFPIRAAAFARAAALPPALYNDMSGGGYLAWDDPLGGGVFIDGRLEVYDTPFVTDYVIAVSDPGRWQADADRYGIQTAIIFHHFENERALIGSLFQGHLWTLVYGDEAAAIFVRTQGNAAAIARAASMRAAWDQQTEAWLARPIQKWPYPGGRVEATRAYARFLATVGAAAPAIDAYLHYVELGVPAKDEVYVRLLLARYFAAHGQLAQAQDQARRILAIAPENAEARALLG